MQLKNLVNEVLTDAAFRRDAKPYRDVYFIKVLNPGDRKSLFVSFRYKLSSNDAIIVRMDIDLSKTDNNVTIGMSYLKVRERQSFTFFKKGMTIAHKNISEIINQTVVPLFVEKLKKVENIYGSDSSGNSIRSNENSSDL